MSIADVDAVEAAGVFLDRVGDEGSGFTVVGTREGRMGGNWKR